MAVRYCQVSGGPVSVAAGSAPIRSFALVAASRWGAGRWNRFSRGWRSDPSRQAGQLFKFEGVEPDELAASADVQLESAFVDFLQEDPTGGAVFVSQRGGFYVAPSTGDSRIPDLRPQHGNGHRTPAATVAESIEAGLSAPSPQHVVRVGTVINPKKWHPDGDRQSSARIRIPASIAMEIKGRFPVGPGEYRTCELTSTPARWGRCEWRALARIFHTLSAENCGEAGGRRWPRLPGRTVWTHIARSGIASAAWPASRSLRLATKRC